MSMSTITRSPIQFLSRLVKTLSRLSMIAAIIIFLNFALFVYQKSNEPMGELGNLGSMTYSEFMADRWQAVIDSEPERGCKGRFTFTVTASAGFSTLHAIRSTLWPNLWASPDDTPRKLMIYGYESIPVELPAPWYKTPDIWWRSFQLMTWSNLGEDMTDPVHLRFSRHCYLPPVKTLVSGK